MTREEMLLLAKEAGWRKVGRGEEYPVLIGILERFVQLHKEKLISEGWRKCAEGQKTTQFCGLLEEAVKAEREAGWNAALEEAAEYAASEGNDLLADSIRELRK